MIQHLLGEIPPDFEFSDMQETRDRQLAVYDEMIRASIQYRDDNTFRMPPQLFSTWVQESSSKGVHTMMILIGRTRRADLIEVAVCNIWETLHEAEAKLRTESLLIAVIPVQPDAQAEILALECFKRVRPLVSRHSDRLLLAVAGGCCSVVIAEFLCTEGARVDCVFGGSRPILSAAKQTGLEAAKLMAFLLRKGAKSSFVFGHKTLSEFPGPMNIHKWIGMTWEELVEAQGSAKRS